MNLMEKWKQFFCDAGIPTSDASTYAFKFSRNRIQTNMLTELNKDYLKEMGITIMGDIISILRHSKQVYEEIQRNEKQELIEGKKKSSKKKDLKLLSKNIMEESKSKLCLNNLSQKRKSEVVKPTKKVATDNNKKPLSSLTLLNNDNIEDCEDVGYLMVDPLKKTVLKKRCDISEKVVKPQSNVRFVQKPVEQLKSNVFSFVSEDDDDDDDNVEVIINSPIVSKFTGFNRFPAQEKFDTFSKFNAITQLDQNKKAIFKRLDDVSQHSVTSTTTFEDEEKSEKRCKEDTKNSVFCRLGQKCDVTSTSNEITCIKEKVKTDKLNRNSFDKTAEKTYINKKIKNLENDNVTSVVKFRPTYSEGILSNNSSSEQKLSLKERLGSVHVLNSTNIRRLPDVETPSEYHRQIKKSNLIDYYELNEEAITGNRKRVSFGNVSEKLIPNREEAIRNGELELASERISVFERLGFNRNY